MKTYQRISAFILLTPAISVSGVSREYVLQPYRSSVDLQIDYETELNDSQRAAVTALPGAALVIAGAGSGKTRTLTYRVAYLLEQGVPADRILLLTFTNKAALEMMDRVTDLIGRDMSELWVARFTPSGIVFCADTQRRWASLDRSLFRIEKMPKASLTPVSPRQRLM